MAASCRGCRSCGSGPGIFLTPDSLLAGVAAGFSEVGPTIDALAIYRLPIRDDDRRNHS
jgi:hypothetical protein